MSMRNIAIIAHVDHGKTTLVDKLLQQSGTYRDNQRIIERVMDSNELEKERGITILAKATSVVWKDTRINIVDTPGHADFGGEVERILNMVDSAPSCWSTPPKGPMPQTKFVVSKALKLGLRPIVAINKVDKPDARVTEVDQRGVRPVRGARRHRRAARLPDPLRLGQAGLDGRMTPEGPQDQGLAPMYDLILSHVPEPRIEEGPFRMLGTLLEANPYLGRIITGRVVSGSAKPNQQIKVLSGDGTWSRPAASPRSSLSAASSAPRSRKRSPATSSPSPVW